MNTDATQNDSLTTISYHVNDEGWAPQMDWNPAFEQTDRLYTERRDTAFSNSRTNTGSTVSELESNTNTVPSSWNMGVSDGTIVEGVRDLSWPEDMYSNGLESPRGEAFDLLGSFGLPGTDSGSYQSLNEQVTTFRPVLWKPPLPFDSVMPDIQHREPALSISSPKNNGETSSNISDAGCQISRTSEMISPPVAFPRSMTDDKLVKLLISYIQTMLQKGQYPPFVHPKLYKCVEGQVAESLANAFCSLAAKNASVPSSEGFVYVILNSERSRLVAAFVSLRCRRNVARPR